MNAESFFLNNHKYLHKLEPLPNKVSEDYQIADWLLNQSNFGWLELDIKFDLEKWKSETSMIKPFLVPHRDNESQYWKSACLHGIDIESTGSFTEYGYKTESAVPYNWTELAKLTPSITNFWKKFPIEKYKRIRFMELGSQGFINPHSDAPGKLPGENQFDALEVGVPINLAIMHPPECYMTLEQLGTVPFQEGKAFIINIRNVHSVINYSTQTRIHMIAHGKFGNKVSDFVSLVANSYKKQYKKENHL